MHNTCKMALRNIYVFETVNTVFTNVMSLLITLPAPDGDDQAKFWQVLFYVLAKAIVRERYLRI